MRNAANKLAHFLLIGGVPFLFVVGAPAALLAWYVHQPQPHHAAAANAQPKPAVEACMEPGNDAVQPEDPTL